MQINFNMFQGMPLRGFRHLNIEAQLKHSNNTALLSKTLSLPFFTVNEVYTAFVGRAFIKSCKENKLLVMKA